MTFFDIFEGFSFEEISQKKNFEIQKEFFSKETKSCNSQRMVAALVVKKKMERRMIVLHKERQFGECLTDYFLEK